VVVYLLILELESHKDAEQNTVGKHMFQIWIYYR
jgi:hypothetical protein